MLEQNAIAPPVGKVSINLGNLDAWLGKEQEYVKPREQKKLIKKTYNLKNMVLENSENDDVSEIGNSEDDDFFEKQLHQPV